jgi:hypothetical protein
MNALDISPGPELNNSNIATRLNGYIGGYGTLVNCIISSFKFYLVIRNNKHYLININIFFSQANFEAELPNLHLDDKMADYIRRAMQKGSRVNC